MKVPIVAPVLTFIVLFSAYGIYLNYTQTGTFSILTTILVVFLVTNVLNCYWEICLFLRRNYVEERAGYWTERQSKTGESPATAFFLSRIPITSILSPSVWADVWAAYSTYDASFTDRRTYGFNVDVGNGFITLIPTAVLFAAYTTHFMSAWLAGLLGLMLYWQLTYMTCVYWLSFFVAKRHKRLTKTDLFLIIGALNGIWVVLPVVGLYVSIQLVIDGTYQFLLS